MRKRIATSQDAASLAISRRTLLKGGAALATARAAGVAMAQRSAADAQLDKGASLKASAPIMVGAQLTINGTAAIRWS